MSLETIRNLIKVLCGVMALVNMVVMIKAKKAGDTNEVIENGFWAIIMTLIWKL